MFAPFGGTGTERFNASSNDVASTNFDSGNGFDVVSHGAFWSTGIALTLNGTGHQDGAQFTCSGIMAVVATAGADNLLVGGGGLI